MTQPRDLPLLIRALASNSFQFLFRQDGNVADLLRWRAPRIARRIDFGQVV